MDPANAYGSTLVSYAELASDVTVSSTSEASPTDVLAVSEETYDGATTVEIEFFCPVASLPDNATNAAILVVNLWDDVTDLGRIAIVQHPAQTTSNMDVLGLPIVCKRRLKPALGAHTFKVRAWRINANCTLVGSSPRVPMYLRVRVD